MRTKSKSNIVGEPVKCIILLSSDEADNWDKAERKENKQLNCINKYAKAHNLIPMYIYRRKCFGYYEMNRIFTNMLKMLDSGRADAVLVANTLSISSGIADAYHKVGRVVENGHRFFSVDEGELKMKIYNPKEKGADSDGN